MELTLTPFTNLPSTAAPTLDQESASSAQNVVFISIDDLNDWVGALEGYVDVKTPNLDRLAAQGMVFKNAHTPVPVCNAARTATMTGLQADTTGIFDNSQDWREIIPDGETLPEYFRTNGYRTAGTGKLFHYHKNSAFDEYFNGRDPQISKDQKGRFGSAALDIPDTEYRDVQNANYAANWLQDNQSEGPFFLSVGFNRPHLPLTAPQEFFDLYPIDQIQLPNEEEVDDLDDIPEFGKQLAGRLHELILKKGEWAEIVQAYLANISFVDAQVGKVLDAVEQNGLAENTIIALWSDHGWHLGEKLHWQKRTLWEEATRVPLMISAPGITTPGSSTDIPVSLVDLFPTLTDLTNITPKQVDGSSLRPLLENPDALWNRAAVSTWDNHYAVRTRFWRYIRYSDGTEELYNHAKDPNELTNVVDAKSALVAKNRLANHLDNYFAKFAPERLLAPPTDLIIRGDLDNDQLKGTAGNDTLIGLDGDDRLYGEAGHDDLRGGPGNDVLRGGTGDDTLSGGAGNDTVNGSEGNDLLKVTTNGNSRLAQGIITGDSTDQLYNIERVRISGNRQKNRLNALDFSRGSVTLDGDRGDDTLIGSKGNDYIDGGPGNDTLILKGKQAQISISDHLTRGAGMDEIRNIEVAIVEGTNRANVIDASDFKGKVVIRGQGGQDVLIPSQGHSRLVGGHGADTFHIDRAQGKRLHIDDFDSRDGDRIAIQNDILGSQLDAGQIITEAMLIIGSQATNQQQRFIFDPSENMLWFDADGVGEQAAIALAKLDITGTLTAQALDII